MLKNIFKTKKFQFFAVFCVCFVACFGISLVARATTEEILTMIIGYPLNIVAALLGQAVKIAGSILDWVLSPTAFGLIKDNAVIDIGWTIVRDLVNMFFILILLVVAFAKVLDISKFKNDIVIIRLVVAALMINFSKVICMFMIDAANILTMFFVKECPTELSEKI